MLNRSFILLLALGAVACQTRLHVGNDGTGGHGAAGVGAAGSNLPLGTGGTGGAITSGAGGNAASGTGGSVVATGTGGAAGQPGAGGAPAQATGLSINPTSATFADTLVEAVSAARTFMVRNESGAAAQVATALSAAFGGTNTADFQLTSNSCGTTLQPGASCEVGVAFAPKTRSGARNATLSVSASNSAPASVSLSGTALPSLGLLAGGLGGPGSADGAGATARFNNPVSVASDGAGNLYVADSYNYTIRKVVIATGVVSTIAGTPQQTGNTDGVGSVARFSNLEGITSDGAGNLYVADYQSIRMIVIATGTVTTLVDDTGKPVHVAGPTGITSDGAGYLYVADTNTVNNPNNANIPFTDSTIRRISVATGTVTTLADRTGVSIHFDDLHDLVSDRAGKLYLADSSAIEQVAIATGTVTTLAGALGTGGIDDGTGADAGFSTPGGITLDGAGNLFVTEADVTLGDTIRQVVIATGVVTTLAGAWGESGSADGAGTAARFNTPKGLASDGAGNIYVADVYNDTIRKVVTATAAVSTLAGSAPQETSLDGTGTTARFGQPVSIATDGAGNLYVTDLDANSIRKIVIATGAVSTLAGSGVEGSADGTGSAASFSIPNGLTTDGQGNLYLTDTGNGLIRKVVIATGAVTTLAGSLAPVPAGADGIGPAATFQTPDGITFDGAGDLFVTDAQNATVRKIVIATAAVTTLAGKAGNAGSADGVGPAATFRFPCGIATDGAGNLYVADDVSNTIRKIVIATGAVTTFAGKAGQLGTVDGVGAAARFNGINGLVSDGAGSLYVTDNGLVRKIDTATAAVSTFLGTAGRTGVLLGALPASLNGPYNLTFLPTGEVAIVDIVENAVLMGHL